MEGGHSKSASRSLEESEAFISSTANQTRYSYERAKQTMSSYLDIAKQMFI